MAHLDIRALDKRFGGVVALDQVELGVERGEFVVLLGPSGCGKTTLLRAIAGLEHPDRGTLWHGGRDITRLPAAQRDYGIVFQSYALFPNLTVADNIAYGLKRRRRDRAGVRERVGAMLTLVGLPGVQERFPAQLSGGQQQRIALARALATSPDLLLLDEPLSALDAIERVRLRGEIRQLQQRLGVTTLMVTHDQEEALAMADRVVVMRQGRIQQVGDPHRIYREPANAFVADFIGRANVLSGRAPGDGTIRVGALHLRHRPGAALHGEVRCYVRPEDIRWHDDADGDLGARDNVFAAHIEKTEFLGAHSLVTVQPVDCPEQRLQVQFASNYLQGRTLEPGRRLQLVIPPESLALVPGGC